ncbi:hypothetical protein [Komagataeibacter swingsii]|uniref:Uncharacterized protein n=1 Tax=Komagataeibacter swingsii TaxID=215220 RepID=A0A2V4R994_9PROT|nr:hypothetical protein [Komagataeibacter swingsii]PYD68720.1 hypothetical protein CFR76_13510 [Komagataeibacter swingsii]GBQ64907.1 hypothetical protein AA16373_2949 [Komagataeibacter swingsii DSM 16373]
MDVTQAPPIIFRTYETKIHEGNPVFLPSIHLNAPGIRHPGIWWHGLRVHRPGSVSHVRLVNPVRRAGSGAGREGVLR